MKTLLVILAFAAIVSILTYGIGVAFGISVTVNVWMGIVTGILALAALIACRWFALFFGVYGAGMSSGEAAWGKPIFLVAGFSPLAALIAGIFFGFSAR